MAEKKKPKPIKRGPVRDNLEAFGVAILAAVLLKYFAIEAYQIPTSSMQPTLMGSVEAGVYDRILVDKFHYTVFEPERWDVAVFRYPLQKNQNYVKRIVGEPGDMLLIAGGNLYLVHENEAGQRTYEVLRKPENIQAGLWKEVYPLRRLVRNDTWGKFFAASPSRSWREEGEDVVVDLDAGRTGFLRFVDDEDGGLVNRVWDGYPVAVSRDMREAHRTRGQDLQIVPDVRIHATLTPERAIEEAQWQIEVLRPGHDRLVFEAFVTGGKGTLRVLRGRSTEPEKQSDPFDLALSAGEATEVVFARRDDRLSVWLEGDLAMELDVSDFPVHEGVAVPPTGPRPDQAVVATLRLKGGGETRVSDLRIDRDLHYTLLGLEEGTVIEVPEGHYYMMGDNTLQSVDSRGWTAIAVGVMPDGTLVPPGTEGSRTVRGNMRPVSPGDPPDRDETPIPFAGLDTLVMIDEFGEVHRFRTRIDPAWGQSAGDGSPPTMQLGPLDAIDGTQYWQPPDELVPFVPREHMVGRALFVFWPFWPFGPQRVGFIR